MFNDCPGLFPSFGAGDLPYAAHLRTVGWIYRVKKPTHLLKMYVCILWKNGDFPIKNGDFSKCHVSFFRIKNGDFYMFQMSFMFSFHGGYHPGILLFCRACLIYTFQMVHNFFFIGDNKLYIHTVIEDDWGSLSWGAGGQTSWLCAFDFTICFLNYNIDIPTNTRQINRQ